MSPRLLPLSSMRKPVCGSCRAPDDRRYIYTAVHAPYPGNSKGGATRLNTLAQSNPNMPVLGLRRAGSSCEGRASTSRCALFCRRSEESVARCHTFHMRCEGTAHENSDAGTECASFCILLSAAGQSL